jgi:hypothetical protein
MTLQIYIYITVIAISFLLSFLHFFRQTSPLFLKSFTPFLFFSLIVELVADRLLRDNKSTFFTYNISSTIEVTFYLWVLFNLITSRLAKKMTVLFIIVYPAASFFDIFFITGKDNFHSLGYSLGCLLIVFFTIVFFYQLFAKPRAILLTREPSFWICTALLFFYSVTFPLFASANFMKSFPPILANNVQYILIVLNVFLYLLFSIAFLCRIKIKKS